MHLRIDELCHSYGTAPVIDHLSLDVDRGESMALLGPSGCGKTTLLRIVAGLERPAAGRVRLGGRLVASAARAVPPEQRKVGMVFQDWALFPHLNVRRNVAFGLRRSERTPERVAAALALVGLADFGERMPATLSGGQQQRVALARALAPRPQILLLDEPFSNLDATLRAAVRTEVRQLLLELGVTSVLVTHDQDEAFVMGDRVGVMRDGAVAQLDTPAELYNHPADRFVANFVGTASWLRAAADGHCAYSAIGRLPLSRPQLGDVDVLLRPEQLRLTRAPDGDGGAVGTVDLVEYYGHDAMAVVGLDGGQLRVRCEPDVPLRRGDRVAVHFAGSTAAGFPALDGGVGDGVGSGTAGTEPAVPARPAEAQPRPRRPVAVPLAAD